MCQVMVLPNGMGEMKTILNGNKAKMVSMAGAKVLTEIEVNDMKVDALLFLEMNYKDANLKIELTGAKDIEGAKTHEVTVTYPSGKKGKRYYDVKTGLLLSKVDEKGSAVYSDYQAFDGIMFFTKGKVESPQGQVGLTVEKVEVNVNLADADFAVE